MNIVLFVCVCVIFYITIRSFLSTLLMQYRHFAFLFVYRFLLIVAVVFGPNPIHSSLFQPSLMRLDSWSDNEIVKAKIVQCLYYMYINYKCYNICKLKKRGVLKLQFIKQQ